MRIEAASKKFSNIFYFFYMYFIHNYWRDLYDISFFFFFICLKDRSGKGVCSDIHASLSSLQTTVAYSYVLYDWKQPLYYRLPGPQSYVLPAGRSGGLKSRFFSRSLLDTYVGVHVHKRGHRQKMIALPPLNLNIILQVSSYSSYCILIVSRQKQSILVV